MQLGKKDDKFEDARNRLLPWIAINIRIAIVWKAQKSCSLAREKKLLKSSLKMLFVGGNVMNSL
jgi:hypothetical protein